MTKFTITSKLIGSITEQTAEVKAASLAALEETLQKIGECGRISYYLYGPKGTKRENLTLMAFI